jgi:hypothetical protein
MRSPVQCSHKQLIGQLPCTGLPPTPHVPLLRHERARGEAPEHEAVLLRYAVDQRTPLRPMPLAMQRSPLMGHPRSPACDQPPRTKASSPLVSVAPLVASSPLVRTPSKFAPYTGDRYTLQGVLGKGAFGLVSLMREVRSGEVVAMKTIERARLLVTTCDTSPSSCTPTLSLSLSLSLSLPLPLPLYLYLYLYPSSYLSAAWPPGATPPELQALAALWTRDDPPSCGPMSVAQCPWPNGGRPNGGWPNVRGPMSVAQCPWPNGGRPNGGRPNGRLRCGR